MTDFKSSKIIALLPTIMMAICLLGVISLFLLSLSSWAYIAWIILSVVGYAAAEHFKSKHSNEFDFYQVAEPIGRQERRKKQGIEDRVAFHMADGGLDPMVLFDEHKSGVFYILKISKLTLNTPFTESLQGLGIESELQGHPIAGQTLMAMCYQEGNGYYRITESEKSEIIEFAFPEKTEKLYDQVSLAIAALLLEQPNAVIKKVNVSNFQAMVKFYHYVQRLSDKENRCVEYLSYHQGSLKICNSSYVELYDCTLQNTLTSWTNQDGLILTDNVNCTNENELPLTNIELPYPESRLIDIYIVEQDDTDHGVKLYLKFVELRDGELTGEVSSLSLLMQNDLISIIKDEVFENELISIDEYFEQKSYPQF